MKVLACDPKTLTGTWQIYIVHVKLQNSNAEKICLKRPLKIKACIVSSFTV